MRLVLASASPWRRELLERAGVPCEGRAHRVEEAAFEAPDPAARAQGLALAKARSVAAELPDALVLGADQVCHVDGAILHKPGDAGEQLRQLVALAGRRHELVTGVALVGPEGERVFSETTGMRMRALPERELAAYVATGEGRACAGGYQVEGRGAQLVERVEGDWFNVVGLPVLRVIDALRELGWRPWTAG